MATELPKIIGIITSKLPFDLANMLYHEFEVRYKEVNYFINKFSYYKQLKNDLRLIEILLALSIFHKRVITNLDAVIKFQATIRESSEATVIRIGHYELDQTEKNKLLGILINYRKIRERFGLNDYVFEYTETKEFLRQIVKFKKSFGKKITKAGTEKKRRTVSPFRNVDELEKEVIKFMNIHKASFSNHAKRISDYFEMCCFNYVVKFYKAKGYEVEVENLQEGKYRYKCSSQGNQENFSNFKIIKKKHDTVFEFGIYHNLTVQSAHQEDIYTTPDISIINYGTVKSDDKHYEGKRKLSYVGNENLISFCEVKQFPPFPELMFSFIGVVNELMEEIMNKTQTNHSTIHIAPALMISGKPNAHALRIRDSLEKRYCINIIYDLFAPFGHAFSREQMRYLKTIRQESSSILVTNRFMQNEAYEMPF